DEPAVSVGRPERRHDRPAERDHGRPESAGGQHELVGLESGQHDRGLLAYNLRDFSAALRDLQKYLQLTASHRLNEEERKEQAELREHVKALRKRVASLN